MALVFKTGDISVVIPSYNRALELEKTLAALKPMLKDIKEVIVVDQSENDSTKRLIKSLRNKKIKFVHSKIPSITRARNLGVDKSSKTSKIICFIDDDVTLKPGYFEEIVRIFNDYPRARAVAGYVPYEANLPESGLFERIARRVFLLGGRLKKDDASLVSSYGNRYPSSVSGVINAQWFPGDNMAYRKDLFKNQRFDDNLLGYTVAEDMDFSYRTSLRHPNSVFISPNAKLIHRYSFQERMPVAKASYINQVDHFYFYFKNLNKTAKEKLVFAWNILGITLLRIALFTLKPSKVNNLKLKFYFESLFYSLVNIDKIRKGRVRDFLNKQKA